jgi:metal-responsive CopG/Arc/MetJ family transcriptional regulator
MKTAISIPDVLFQRADEVARRTGKSRSQLYQEALVEYLDRRAPSTITAALNDVVDEVGPGVDEWTAAAGRRILESTEW